MFLIDKYQIKDINNTIYHKEIYDKLFDKKDYNQLLLKPKLSDILYGDSIHSIYDEKLIKYFMNQLLAKNSLIFIGSDNDMSSHKFFKDHQFKNETLNIEKEPSTDTLISSEEKENELEVPQNNITIKKQIKEILLNADQIFIGNELDEIKQIIDVPEQEQRFGVDKQANDLLDDMLSRVPNIQRTMDVMNNIHKMIERFKQLRTDFSKFDKFGNADMPELQGSNFKPLVNTLYDLNKKLYWLLPVCKNKKKLYFHNEEEFDDSDTYNDYTPIIIENSMDGEVNTLTKFHNNTFNNKEGENKFNILMNDLNTYLTPFEQPNNEEFYLTSKQINDNILGLLDNTEEFKSSVVRFIKAGKESFNSLKERKFVFQNYNISEVRKINLFIR
jgi:hypothetical protein